jgi:carbon monoxide dehydrogenase subunit G
MKYLERMNKKFLIGTLLVLGIVTAAFSQGKTLNFSKEIVINVPAEKVWNMIGRDIADIEKWDSGVSHSVVVMEGPKLDGAPYVGRVCETAFGKIKERFITFDDKGMTFSFQGDIESKVFGDVLNTVTVTIIDSNTAKVTVTPNVDLKVLGRIIKIVIKSKLAKAVENSLKDMKYFAENDKVSPRKLKTQK